MLASMRPTPHAPSLALLSALLEEGAKVRAYDPAAMTEAGELFPDVQLCKDAYECAEGADAAVIVTEWNQFRMLDLERLKSAMHEPVLVDLRNIYEPQAVAGEGFRYLSIGRPDAEPAP